MKYKAFSSDLPSEQIITFRSVEENAEALLRMNINQEMHQLRRGPFRSDLSVRSVGSAVLFADRFSSACRIHLEPPLGMVALLWLKSAGAPLLASGVDVANDKLMFLPKSTAVNLILPDLGGSEVIAIPDMQYREMLAAFFPSCDPLERVTFFEGDTAQLQTLGCYILRMLNEPGEDLQAERLSNLLAATFSWIGETHGPLPPEVFRSQGACRQVAKKVEEFIYGHYRGEVNMEDICRESGIGLRSLQRAVRHYFDVTTTELLESVRLEAAHRDLSTQRPEQTTVTQIALDSGFTHLGRFSLAYYHRYGVKPSEQLAQLPGRKS